MNFYIGIKSEEQLISNSTYQLIWDMLGIFIQILQQTIVFLFIKTLYIENVSVRLIKASTSHKIKHVTHFVRDIL